MHVPFMDLSRIYETCRDDILNAVTEVLDSQRYIGGPVLTLLETQMADFVGVKHAIGVSSGTDALLVSMMAAGIGPGDEVITTPFTFFATVGSILRLGAVPVFVDIELETYNLDVHQVEAALTEKTRAILPVHLFGHMIDMAPLMALAQKHDLVIIEDAAQAIGSSCPDGNAAGVGHFGCLSFFPTKNLGAAGDGGMVLTDDDTLADRVRIMAKHGAKPKYIHKVIGGNFRLDALQAAILNQKLPHLPSWNAQRIQNAAWYHEHIVHPDVVKPIIREGFGATFHQYCVRVPERAKMQQALKARGVDTMVYYPRALHEQEALRDLTPQSCPNASLASEHILALPIFPGLTQQERDHVARSVNEVVGAL